MKKIKKEVWVMSCSSESGDHYDCCESWDHEPSKEEIDRVRVKLDSVEWDDETDGEWEGPGEFAAEIDGQRYAVYISSWNISKIIV